MKKRKVKVVPKKSIRPSLIKSGFTYVYLAVFFALLSGLFYPLIKQASFDEVIMGTLTLFLGLAGGIMLYRVAAGSNKALFLGAGLGMMAASVYFIFKLGGRI